MDLNKQIIAFIKSITPPGTQVLLGYRTPIYCLDFNICCDGRNGHNCCGRAPGHAEKCYDFCTNTDFERQE